MPRFKLILSAALLLPAAALAQKEDVYPHGGLSPKEAAAAMKVPAGFRVELFAGEPEIQQPIGFAIDDRGRLWVAESYSYPLRQKEGQERDRILIFEDTDGDGRFDRRKVFKEKLNLLSGLEVGFGGVWVGAAPQFLFIPDADGDDVPDGEPEVLLDGWGYQDTHETLNAFTWGPDGWLYGCHGVFTHSRVGKPGTPEAERQRLNAAIWRYHPRDRLFEVFCHGTSNPWGVDFDDRGQAFLTACVIPHLYHVIQGGRYERQAGEHFNRHTYDDLKTIADHRHWVGGNPHGGNNRSDSAGGGHAHCGAMLYLGGAWPAEYRGSLFMSNIHGQRINRDLLEPRGSGFVGKHAPDFLLAEDRWSQIVSLQYGPDGQVYLLDWYDKQACHTTDPRAVDRSNGRLFKVIHGAPAPVRELDLAKRTDAELVELQLHQNDWHVRHARRLLQERAARRELPAPLAERLSAIAFEHPDDTRRLRGLWALHASRALTPERVNRALSNSSPHVRGWAVQLALEARRPWPELLERLASLARLDPSPVVRLYLASGLDRLPLEARPPILEGLLARGEDASDHNLPLMLWYALEPLAGEDPRRALELAGKSRSPLVMRYTARRVGSPATQEALDLVAAALARLETAESRLALLRGLDEALRGRREAPLPAGWSSVAKKLERAGGEASSLALELAVKFRDPSALAETRAILLDRKAELTRRQRGLTSLLGVRDPELPRALETLLEEPVLRAEALRALGHYDHPRTWALVLPLYARLSFPEKREALATLAARTGNARELLRAVASKEIPSSDLPAELVRQMRNLKDAEVDRLIAGVWGVVGETSEEKARLIRRYRKLLTEGPRGEPDVSLGRAVFVKACAQCHTLFGSGGKVAPELTGANRSDLDYLLSNVLDPSALIGKDYQAQVVFTTDGRVLTGLVREEGAEAYSITTANETVVLPRKEVQSREETPLSVMPDDLLKPLSDGEVQALFVYLASPRQAPVLATPETVKGFFNGKDLQGWEGKPELWRVEEGEIVGRTTGLERNEFLRSELLAGDFRLSLKVKLAPDEGNSGVQFRSQALPAGEVKGYQADVGKGWWGKLYEEHGRGLLWKESGEPAVKRGEWNEYRIEARGSRLQTWINGRPCADLDDPAGARRGIFALQLHSGPAMEVRYKDLKLEILDG